MFTLVYTHPFEPNILAVSLHSSESLHTRKSKSFAVSLPIPEKKHTSTSQISSGLFAYACVSSCYNDGFPIQPRLTLTYPSSKVGFQYY